MNDNKEILTNKIFKKFSEYFYNTTGILIKENKKYLVEHRLSKFIGYDKEFTSFEEFYSALINDKTGELKTLVIQALTTNWTFFFREDVHFNFLKEYLKDNYKSQPYIRIWSAGCSTGEEAYSVAITALEAVPEIEQFDFRILATDVSLQVLKSAYEGVYHYSKIKGAVPDKILKKYFIFDKEKKNFIVKDEVKNLVYFRYLNLMDNYPFQKEFDVVFLRNVLIYFDKREKEYILEKVYNVIKKGKYLILGLSESLIGIRHPFILLKNSIYQKR